MTTTQTVTDRSRSAPAAPADRVLDAVGPEASPYPPRGASEALKGRVCGLLRSGAWVVGDRFFTDEELVRASGLSRSTVRRALGGLREEGWLQSHAGLGTFVGQVLGPGEDTGTRPIRLGVLAFSGRNPAHDWFTGDVVRGLSSPREAAAIRVELLPGYADGLRPSLDRLEAAAPDVLVCLSVSPDDALLTRMAAERGMRCLVAGTAFPEIEQPRVMEDNSAGVEMVVSRLAVLGHRRVGMTMRRWTGPWVFERHEQWMNSCREHGLVVDEGLAHWLPRSLQDFGHASTDEALAEWLGRARPTALICGHYAPVENLGHLVRSGRLAVPADLSVAVMDQQHPAVARQLGRVPSGAITPLVEIGERLTELAIAWERGETPPALSRLPMRWHEGATTPASETDVS